MHVHDWQMRDSTLTTHFENVPNSRQKHKFVYRMICDCGQKGFRYPSSRVVYTWSPADVDAD